MKILLVGRIDKVRNFHGALTVSLKKSFEKAGVEVDTLDIMNPYFVDKKYDLVVSVARYSVVKRFTGNKYNSIVTAGRLISVGEHSNITQNGETVFGMTRGGSNGNIIRVHWAGDADVLYPEKKNNRPYLLIDHAYSNHKALAKFNYNMIFDDLMKVLPEFVDKYDLEAHLLRCPDLNKSDFMKMSKDEIFKIVAHPWSSVLPFYRKAHMFLVTHFETCGFSIIESAMCGAKQLIPNGYVAHDMWKDLDHITFNYKKGRAEALKETLEKAINSIDVDLAVKKASKFTWDKIIEVT